VFLVGVSLINVFYPFGQEEEEEQGGGEEFGW